MLKIINNISIHTVTNIEGMKIPIRTKFTDINDLLSHFRYCKKNNLKLPSFDDIYNKIKKLSLLDMLWKASQFELLDDITFIKFLIDNVKDIHENDDEMLRYASIDGHLIVVKYLIEHGANIHANNDEALRKCAEYDCIEMVKYLVENGADMSLLNSDFLNKHKNVFRELKLNIIFNIN